MQYCAKYALLSKDDTFKFKLRELTSQLNVKSAFECVGGEMTGTVLNSLQSEGILYHYGNLSLRPINGLISKDFIFLNKKIVGFWLFEYLKGFDGIIEEFKEDYFSNSKDYITNIVGIYKPEDFQSAIKQYKEQMSRGKVLLDFS